jgi:hypothetical protein
MSEVVANRYVTTLSSSVDNVTTTIPLASVVGAPSGGSWRLAVESELMLVNLVVGSSAVVTRGVEGTTAAAHASGVTASHVLTAGGITALIGQNPAWLPLTTVVGGVPDFVWDADNNLVLTQVTP